MSIVAAPQSEHVVELSWDTEHFGFLVAKIDAATLAEGEVRQALRAAREQGIRLAYAFDSASRQMPPAILRDFSGRLVDRKATFELDLAKACELREDPSFEVYVYGESKPTAALTALALAAGAYSRYHVDPQFPQDKFESLMRTWIANSTSGAIADVVLVARRPGSSVEDGMVTIQLSQSVGRIGLVAVSEQVRGRGLGTLLMAAAHRWMIRRGASRSSVPTQFDNAPACKLYQRAGYELAQLQHVYHFWL